jgi:hypothetical protein
LIIHINSRWWLNWYQCNVTWYQCKVPWYQCKVPWYQCKVPQCFNVKICHWWNSVAPALCACTYTVAGYDGSLHVGVYVCRLL